jgi:hypothetical protein
MGSSIKDSSFREAPSLDSFINSTPIVLDEKPNEQDMEPMKDIVTTDFDLDDDS